MCMFGSVTVGRTRMRFCVDGVMERSRRIWDTTGRWKQAVHPHCTADHVLHAAVARALSSIAGLARTVWRRASNQHQRCSLCTAE
jgi:hypothetical protein